MKETPEQPSLDSISQTQGMLAKHHGDGEAFVQLMKDTYAGRFNDEFWALWQEYVEPVFNSKDDAGVSASAKTTIVDLGAGPGTFIKAIAEKYPQVQAVGVEVANYMLDAIEKLPDNAEIVTADLRDPHLPFDMDSVDAAVASVVLHEMYQPIKTFFELGRCLKPGAMFYILDWVRAPLQQYVSNTEVEVFNQETTVDSLDDLFVHFSEHNRFSADDLIYMLEQCGFEIVYKEMINENQMVRLIAKKK